MSKRQVLMLIGALIVADVGLFGLPGAWNRAFLALSGLIIIFVSYRLDRGRPASGAESDSAPRGDLPFSERKRPATPATGGPASPEPAVIPKPQVTNPQQTETS